MSSRAPPDPPYATVDGVLTCLLGFSCLQIEGEVDYSSFEGGRWNGGHSPAFNRLQKGLGRDLEGRIIGLLVN